MEIDEKYKILHPGDVVIDCGASPGSWTQVAVNKCNPKNSKNERKYKDKSLIIGIDRVQIYPIEVNNTLDS